MIDLKALREDPQRFRQGAQDKGIDDGMIGRLLDCDQRLRAATAERQELAAEKNRIGKSIGLVARQLKQADASQREALEAERGRLQQRPQAIKQREGELSRDIAKLEATRNELWACAPQPADPKVPVGRSEHDNVVLRSWHPAWFDPSKPFVQNKGFEPRSHIELGQHLRLFDFERGVKMSGSRSYVLTGFGMLLHQAVLRLAFDFMIHENGFTAVSVPVLVREPIMFGTAFFPQLKEDAYEMKETLRGGGYDLYLTGTGEVGLMGYHGDEVLEIGDLPKCYTTTSTCFRREAGAAGKDTAGLYRIHQFDKVEQVVLCEADPEQSCRWHQRMIGFVETLMQRLELPYQLTQVCTADMGPAKVDQVDIDCWMPSRGAAGADGRAMGAYGETHSASALHDYQTRRLNIRYKDSKTQRNRFCYSLNNTVIASPRILIPILELYQNQDESVSIPAVLRPYLGSAERIEKQ